MLQVTTVTYGFYNIPYKSMHVYTGITQTTLLTRDRRWERLLSLNGVVVMGSDSSRLHSPRNDRRA